MTDIALPLFDPIAYALAWGVALVYGVPLVLLALVVLMRLVHDLFAPARLAVAHDASPRLRIVDERHPRGMRCESCGGSTRWIVVVRLYDDTTRVCRPCASVLAPEVAA